MLGKYDLMAFVSTADMAVGRAFYEGVLGLSVRRADDYGVIFDANGIGLRMSLVRQVVVAPYSVMSWVVPDIHAMISGLMARGVVFEKYDGFGQDDAGVWTAPDGTQVAWFKDPAGHLLSLSHFV